MKRRKILLFTLLSLFIMGGIAAYVLYDYVFSANLKLAAAEKRIYIRRGMDFEAVVQLLNEHGLEDEESFRITANAMEYEQVRHGSYMLKNGMSNKQLVSMLRAGLEAPVRFSFISKRTMEEFVHHTAPYFEFSKEELAQAMQNPKLLAQLKVNRQTLSAILIPDTYQLYWSISAEEFLLRMRKEYDKYWTKARIAKAKAKGLSPLQAMVVASIVQAETNKNDEKATIAGVYLNRLKKGMRLEADPTVKFAVGDFSIKRVLHRHIESSADNPYNTYRNHGIPPGPINTPEKPSIEAVLHAEAHDYYYFCASAKRSGYHTFSRNLKEHNRAAKAYHRFLNQREIYE